MNTQLLVPFLFLSSLMHGQALHIHYNLQNSQTVYVVDGDTISRPSVRQQSEVFLHLENFNTYRYSAEVERIDDQSKVSANFGGLSPLTNLLSPAAIPATSGFEVGGYDESFGGSGAEYEEWEDPGTARGFASAAVDQELVELQQTYRNLLLEMDATEVELIKVNENLQQTLVQRRYAELALNEIRYVKYHPGLTPGQIRKISTELAEKVVGGTDDFDAIDFVENQAKTLKTRLGQLKRLQTKYGTQLITLADLQQQLPGLEPATTSPLYASLNQSVERTSTSATALQENTAENERQTEEALTADQDTYLRTLINLRYELATLQANSFTYTERFSAESGGFSLKATLHPLDTNGVRTDGQTITLPPIQVDVRGGLRISTSVGLSLGQYFDVPQEYTVRDGIIVGAEKDRFVPIANTFFHFHPYGTGRVVVGGSLGIGLPLSGSDAVQSTTFLLGPSLVFGGRDRVMLTAGLLGGQVNRLGAGLTVGDTFTSTNGVLTTRSRYELGYFFALSFRLFGT